jgi:hypothetical protein
LEAIYVWDGQVSEKYELCCDDMHLVPFFNWRFIDKVWGRFDAVQVGGRFFALFDL